MRFVFLLAWLAAMLAASAAHAQTDNVAAPAFSPWSLGVRAGTGSSTTAENAVTPLSALTGGLTGSYFIARPQCSIQLGARVEDEQVNPHRVAVTHNALLLLPLLIRTGSPTSRLHFVLGGGPAIRLTQHDVSQLYPANFRYLQTTGCLVTGLEVRLTPPKRLETTLALTLRVPFGPSIQRSNYASRIPSSYPDGVTANWLGFTLNVYYNPAARP